MNIDKILSIDVSDRERLRMILSNRFDLMYKGKAAITYDVWDILIEDLMAFTEDKIKQM